MFSEKVKSVLALDKCISLRLLRHYCDYATISRLSEAGISLEQHIFGASRYSNKKARAFTVVVDGFYREAQVRHFVGLACLRNRLAAEFEIEAWEHVPDGASAAFKPDVIAVLDGARVAIELDCGEYSRKRLEGKMHEFQKPMYKRQLWAFTSAQRKINVERLLKNQRSCKTYLVRAD